MSQAVMNTSRRLARNLLAEEEKSARRSAMAKAGVSGSSTRAIGADCQRRAPIRQGSASAIRPWARVPAGAG